MINDIQKIVICMEECGELIRACSKVIRHGVENPKYLENLQEEIADVKAMIMILQQDLPLDRTAIEGAVQKRLTKMSRPEYE